MIKTCEGIVKKFDRIKRVKKIKETEISLGMGYKSDWYAHYKCTHGQGKIPFDMFLLEKAMNVAGYKLLVRITFKGRVFDVEVKDIYLAMESIRKELHIPLEIVDSNTELESDHKWYSLRIKEYRKGNILKLNDETFKGFSKSLRFDYEFIIKQEVANEKSK